MPEPSSIALLAIASVGLASRRRGMRQDRLRQEDRSRW
ncbi:MAG: PEP-CTERM sorting domain-containing protein [Candidatus Accumulibacter sp.]|nr:PEP-CTERM sorting domain-containing protein [Accumulibacter sp.]